MKIFDTISTGRESTGLMESPLAGMDSLSPTLLKKQEKPPTLEDLGKILGLSKRAVSQALNDRAGTVKVSPATRERVRALAKTLGYRQNMAATALTTGRTGMYGIFTSFGRMHMISMRLAAAIDQFRSFGISPLVIYDNARNEHEEEENISALINSHVDGVLIVQRSPHLSDAHVEELRRYDMALVQVGGTTAARNISHYLTDRRQAFELIVKHLLAQGYRNLAALVSDDASLTPGMHFTAGTETRIAVLEAVNRLRNQGVEINLVMHNIPPARQEVTGVHSLYDPGYSAMHEIIRNNKVPEALICQVDGWAWGAMRACAEAGIRIPHDMAITGYSNEPTCSATYIPLTSVAEPFEEMCRTGIAELVGAVKDGRQTANSPIVMPCELIPRLSSTRPLS